jgi:hypothetical protein
MAKNNVKQFLYTVQPLNLSRIVCNHVVGKEHSHVHRRVAGGVIAVVGTIVMQTFFVKIELHVVEIIFHTTGGFLHAVGIIPWLERLEGKE